MKNITFFLLFLLSLLSCSNPPSSEQKEEQDNQERPVNVVGKEITYSTDSTQMTGYLAYDSNMDGRAPGILVIHEWWGHNEYVRKRAEMLAELGYVALAVDMYGNGKKARHPEDAGKFAGEVFSNMEAAKDRFEAAMATLKSQPNVFPQKIGAVGYCFGGSVALSMANAGYDLDAVAAFHSGVELPIPPGDQLSANILVANGADDPMITEEQATRFKTSLDSVGANYKYISYPNTVHAYTSPAADSLGKKFDLPLEYNPKSDSLAWEELKSHLAASFPEE